MKPKIISQIYNAKPSYEYIYDEKKLLSKVSCTIKVNNLSFYGNAQTHSDDKDFVSNKFGCRLARYRAQYDALTYYLFSYEKMAINARKFFCDVMQNREKKNVDPTNRFTNQLYRYWHYVDCIREERKHFKKAIDATIKSQEKMISVVKKHREEKIND